MGFMEYVTIVLTSAPALLFWIAVIIFGIVMLNRGGGRAERFLIAGGSIKIVANLFIIPSVMLTPWLFGQDYSIDYVNTISSTLTILRNVVSMAGIICLVYAFWVKFNNRSTGPELPLSDN